MGLLDSLRRHVATDADEARDLETILRFVDQHVHPFDRGNLEGHLTGSALVVAESGEQVLLVYHRKLQRWLQPGGHAEAGETSGEAVALREASEETGLGALRLHPTAPRPLDVDVHQIPARPTEPAHAHLDLRYLVLCASDAEAARCTVETEDLRWFAWDELDRLDLDVGLRRLLAKARAIVDPRQRLGTMPGSG